MSWALNGKPWTWATFLLAFLVLAIFLAGTQSAAATIVRSADAPATVSPLWNLALPTGGPYPEVTPGGDVLAHSELSPGSVATDSALTKLTAGGNALWSLPPDAAQQPALAFPSATDAAGNTYFGVRDAEGNQYLESVDPSGTERWITSALTSPECCQGLALGWNGEVYTAGRDTYGASRVVGFDEVTGAQTIDIPLNDVTGLYAYVDGLIVVDSSSVVDYYSYSGDLTASITGGSAVDAYVGFSSASGGNGRLFLAGYSSTACDAPSVEEITPAGIQWKWTGPAGFGCGTSLAATPDGGVVLGAGTSYASIDSGGQTRWTYTPPESGLARGSAPVVDSSGTVMIASSYRYSTAQSTVSYGTEFDFLSEDAATPALPSLNADENLCLVSADTGNDEFYVGFADTIPIDSVTACAAGGTVMAFSQPGLGLNYRLSVTTPPGSPASPMPSLTLTPESGNDPTGVPHAVVANVSEGTTPVPGVAVAFSVSSGPCQGQGSSSTTDAEGNATFTYSCNDAGTDVISAMGTVAGTTLSATATEQWTPFTQAGTTATWAGYVLHEPTLSAFGSITVPTVSCDTVGRLSAWVGIDGASVDSNTVEQDGLSAVCSAAGALPTYYLWYELYKDLHHSINRLLNPDEVTVPLNVTLRPGDRVDASVDVIQPDRVHGVPLGRDKVLFVLSVYRDGARLASWTKTVAEPLAFSPKYDSGECIVETPSEGAFPLPNFGTAVFTRCTPIIDAKSPLDLTRYDISRNGEALTSTSPIFSLDGDFVVNWVASG